MKISPFAVEEWMNAYEESARYNIAETCVDSISVRELLRLCGIDEAGFLEELCSRRLTYGDILGAPALKQGICGLYRTLQPDEIVTTHGAAGANHHLFYSLIEPGDAVIVSGDLGDHHAAILASRMGIENTIVSDNAPLGEMVRALKDGGIRIHEMRDVTRGGLATVLHEFSQACGLQIVLREEDIPVSEKVRSFCGILGLDPLYMGNEGKLVAIVKGEDADEALRLIRSSRYGENAVAAGYVRKAPENESGMLLLETPIGGMRVLGPLFGEGLPRIC